jgi:hypothetical protein
MNYKRFFCQGMLLIGGFIFILCFSGCSWKNGKEVASVQTSLPSALSPQGNWKEYKNIEKKISFSYPGDFTLAKDTPGFDEKASALVSLANPVEYSNNTSLEFADINFYVGRGACPDYEDNAQDEFGKLLPEHIKTNELVFDRYAESGDAGAHRVNTVTMQGEYQGQCYAFELLGNVSYGDEKMKNGLPEVAEVYRKIVSTFKIIP